jgi:hypothetical protein
MPPRNGAVQKPIIQFDGPTGDRLIQPDEVMARIVNMRPTEEGSLKSVQKPMAFPTVTPYDDESEVRGIFHCRIKDRDITIVVEDDNIVEIGPGVPSSRLELVSAAGGLLTADLLTNPNVVDYPPQFCATTTGVVIVPCGGRAYFYDGVTIAEFGFSQKPAAPVGVGPRSSDNKYTEINNYCGINDTGYAVDALVDRAAEMSPVFMRGRLGTIQTPGEVVTANADGTEEVKGYLMSGRYTCRMGWVDPWGNHSAWSEPSNDVVFERQPATGRDPNAELWLVADCARKQVAWDNLSNGPAHAIGKDLARTPDIVQTGDTTHYMLTSNAQPVINTFATIPDNITDLYPDNIPDAWLGTPIVEYDVMPVFRLCWMALGRLWIANWPGAEGAMRPSLPGRWGTLLKDDIYWPDPTGSEITGGCGVPGGMLVFTETSTYFVDSSLESHIVSSVFGCIAPSSIQMMADGSVMFLGRDGFYMCTPPTKENARGVSYAFEDYRERAKFFNSGKLKTATSCFNPSTGQYMCALAEGGSAVNDHIWVFDGQGWNERDGYSVTSMCVTSDRRKLILMTGTVDDTAGVYVIDRGLTDYMPATVETGWLGAMSSLFKSSIRNVAIWIRETGKTDKITVEVMRNWRSDVIQTSEKDRYISGGGAHFYDDTTTYATAVWRKARPFWMRLDIDTKAVETFKLRITADDGIELLGFQFEYQDRNDGAARHAG